MARKKNQKPRPRPNVRQVLINREKQHLVWFKNKLKNDESFLGWVEDCVTAIKKARQK